MRSLDRATERVQTGHGELSVTSTLRGVEAAIGYRPKSWLNLSGYAGRTWAGSVEAGARASVAWGKS